MGINTNLHICIYKKIKITKYLHLTYKKIAFLFLPITKNAYIFTGYNVNQFRALNTFAILCIKKKQKNLTKVLTASSHFQTCPA